MRSAVHGVRGHRAARFGPPTLSVTAGLRSVSLAPDGSFASLSLHGHVLVDVCAALR